MTQNSRLNHILSLAGRYFLLLVLLVLALFPIYWMILSSLRTNSQITALPPQLLPSTDMTFQNYQRIFDNPQFLTYYMNSVVVSVSTVVLCIIVATLAGYSFSRFRFRGRSTAMSAILAVQMFPLVAILISLFAFFSRWGLTNSRLGLILAHLTIALPFSVWFLKSFFDSIPVELEESAYIDGAGRLRTLFQIVMPLARPGIIAVAIYAFLMSWDDFIFGLTLINEDDLRTLPVGIALSFLGEFEYDWAGMMTLSLLASLPILILFIFLNRYMVDGLTQGALKG